MKKRILTLILALLMVLPAFTACSESTENNDAVQENVTADAPSAGEEVVAEETEAELSEAEARLAIPDNLPEQKFDGKEFRILTDDGYSSADFFAEEETGAVVTIEDNTILGGLGSAVAEVLIEKCPVPMQRIGILDQFGESGDPEKLYAANKMTTNDIVEAACSVIRRKGNGKE